jgi:hypothetical protein
LLDNPELLRLTGAAAAHIEIWARDLERSLGIVEEVAAELEGTNQASLIAELLTLGARAAADLLVSSRARSEHAQGQGARTRLDGLVARAADMSSDPFDPLLPDGAEWAFGLQWRAELSRAEGHGDPHAWGAAADAWQEQGRAHREAYCRWRRAQRLAASGGSRADVAPDLQRAFELSVEMVPQRRVVEELAARMHLRLSTTPRVPLPDTELPVALTPREHEILGHLVAGRSNGYRPPRGRRRSAPSSRRARVSSRSVAGRSSPTKQSLGRSA